MLLVFIEIMH